MIDGLKIQKTLIKHKSPVTEFVVAGMQVTQVFSVRLAILTLAMSVFVLFSLVALVDGFVKRGLRRRHGNRGATSPVSKGLCVLQQVPRNLGSGCP